MRDSADGRAARPGGGATPGAGATPSTGALRDVAGRITARRPVRLALRPGGLIEVRGPSAPIGFIDWVPPVFVAYVGPWPESAAEAGQRRRLAEAVELVREMAVASGP